MINYDSTKDRSEDFGWKRICDEYIPTEKEQNRWGIITICLGLVLATITLIGV